MPHRDPQQAWIAFHGIHYHGEWHRYGLTDPRRLDADFAPLAPQDAVDLLSSYQGDQASWLRRAAMAALVRGSDSPTLQNVRGFLRPLALAERMTLRQIAALEAVITQQGIDARFLSALAATEPQGCRIDSFKLTAHLCRPALLSNIEVRATVRRPSSDLASQVDPRQWKVNFPLIWSRSDPVGPLVQFADRDLDSPSIPMSGPNWSSMFFERLSFVAPGSSQNFELSDIRNVLGVSFQSKAGSFPSSTLQYRAVECLSTSFPLMGSPKKQGGIDHDSGFGSVSPVPGNNAKTLIVAKKTLRYTEPSNSLVAMNESSFISTVALLEYMVLSGACA